MALVPSSHTLFEKLTNGRRDPGRGRPTPRPNSLSGWHFRELVAAAAFFFLAASDSQGVGDGRCEPRWTGVCQPDGVTSFPEDRERMLPSLEASPLADAPIPHVRPWCLLPLRSVRPSLLDPRFTGDPWIVD